MSIKPRQWAKQHTSRSNKYEFNGTNWKVKGGDGGLNKLARTVWESMDGTFHIRQYHNVSRKSFIKQYDVMDHLSYLAKIRTKGYAGDKVKSFSSSKIQYPNGEINSLKGLVSNYKL